MPDTSRLTIVTNGAYTHPLDQIPIDIRYSEVIRSPHLPYQSLQQVRGDQPASIDIGTRPARCLVIVNMAGSNIDRYPDEEQAAALRRRVLQICDADGKPLFDLQPAIPGETRMGGGQVCWLAEGVQLMLRMLHPDTEAIARIAAFPRSSED